MKYCSNCSSKLLEKQAGIEWFCSGCNKHLYANPVPTVDVILLDEENRILLGRRNRQPYLGKLNLPGGFIDPGESAEEAIARELYEELGLNAEDFGTLTYAGSRTDSYPTEGADRQLLVMVMVGNLKHQEFEPNKEVSEYVWQTVDALTAEDFTSKREYDHIVRALKNDSTS